VPALIAGDYGARARHRQWYAARAWIPNRHVVPLLEVERLAESSDNVRLREAARETKNWPLLRCLEAMAEEAARIRKKT
jgi:hypothetical protein